MVLWIRFMIGRKGSGMLSFFYFANMDCTHENAGCWRERRFQKWSSRCQSRCNHTVVYPGRRGLPQRDSKPGWGRNICNLNAPVLTLLRFFSCRYLETACLGISNLTPRLISNLTSKYTIPMPRGHPLHCYCYVHPVITLWLSLPLTR